MIAGILTVSGWGSTSEFGNVVPKLRKANMTGVSNSACSTAYSGSATIRSDMMCARGASGEVQTVACANNNFVNFAKFNATRNLI